MQARLVVIPLFDGVQSLDVTGPFEVFAGAAAYTAEQGPAGGRAYRLVTASPGGGPVQTSSGLRLMPTADLRDVAPADVDTLVVPGGSGVRDLGPEFAAWLKKAAPQVRRVTSVCTGV